MNSRAQNRPLLQWVGGVKIETDIIQRASVTTIQGEKQNSSQSEQNQVLLLRPYVRK